MKQYDKRKNQRPRSNADAVAKTNGTASFLPPPFQLKGAERGARLSRQDDKEKLNQDFDTLSREEQYEYALIENDYDPEKVQGYDEFKPGGFRYNPSMSYNLAVKEQQLGYRIVGAQKIGKYWADPGTEAGRVMKTQHHNHGRNLLYGKAKGAYQPSDELLSRQTFQQLGEEQVKQNILALLQYCKDLKKAIRLEINDEATPINEKNNYLAKAAKIDIAIEKILVAIGADTKVETEGIAKGSLAPVAVGVSTIAAITTATALTALVVLLYQEIHEVLEDVVDIALDDLLHDTGVDRGKKKEPTPEPSPVPAPITKEKEADEADEECQVKPVGRHLGNDKIHDACSDLAPPNVFQGSDVLVITPDGRKKHFDAMDASGALWEVKTLNYSSYPDFLKDRVIEKELFEIMVDFSIAKSCGREFVFAVSDVEHFEALEAEIPRGVQLELVDCLTTKFQKTK